MALLLPLFHLAQSALSAYSVYLSTLALPKLQQSGEASERAAATTTSSSSDSTTTTAHPLHTARTTQAAGALVPLISLFSALALLLSPATFPLWARLLLSLANFGAAIFAYELVRPLGQGDAGVPLVADWDDAVTLTNRMVLVLAALAGTWALSAMAVFGPILIEMGHTGGSHGEL